MNYLNLRNWMVMLVTFFVMITSCELDGIVRPDTQTPVETEAPVTEYPKDDEDHNSELESNSFRINGQTYYTTQGVIFNYGQNFGKESGDFDVFLMTDGFVIEDDSEDVSGFGSFVYLDLNSPDFNSLVSGTYTFSNERDPYSFSFADAVINFDTETEDYEAEYVLNSNKYTSCFVEVKKNGENYEIDYIISMENGLELKGKYNGALVSFEDEINEGYPDTEISRKSGKKRWLK
jgi:hypothetical protein